ncbi:MAG: FIST C-terminal domain-containing protein [Candidatus Heimdallarchaeota archaeon]|nr:FIST C-terminal domain-containing protein [Candidatus Heimdallarchaeota archaeon]
MVDNIRCGLFSAKTNVPYRAGRLAAEGVVSQIMDNNPALCLIFFSERYAYPDLIEGITQIINPEIIAGCSTNGEIASGYWRESVIAISLATDYMRFGIAVESNENLAKGDGGIYKKFYERAMADLRTKLLLKESKMTIPVNPKSIKADFGMLFLPGTNIENEPKANEVILNLRKFIGDLPLIGGTIGDDYNYNTSYVIFKDELLEDHTLLILGRSDLEFSMAQKHGYHIINEHILTKVKRNRLISLDNRPAAEVYFNNLNTPVVEIADLRDEICAINPLGVKDNHTGELQILFPMSRGKDDTELTVSQIVPQGTKLYITEANMDESRKASLESIKSAFTSEPIQDPRVGMIFSCAGRSTFYFDHALAEIEEIKNRFKYTSIGGAYLYGTLCGKNSYVSEGTTSTLLIGNDLRKRK